ncbi:MAG TPA: hypothetical protein VJC03_04980 [bacterium]|nr:hypothetical protein [bacterium]
MKKQESLWALKRSKEISIYRIQPVMPGFSRYVVSTPESARLLNHPEIYGFEYIHILREGMKRILGDSIFRKIFSVLDDSQTTVLHFLRGGLNFGLLDLLYRVYGFTRHSASFMTSQRYKTRAHWKIKMDQYRKFVLHPRMNIFSGDVVATGTTLENGLAIIHRLLKKNHYCLANFIFFTVGGKETEAILLRYFKKYRELYKGVRFFLIYLEGQFHLVEKKNEFRICIPETDLVRKGALLTPEFEKSAYASLYPALERCVVYDVGARAFHYQEHLEDVTGYWKSVSKLPLTVEEALLERWPGEHYTGLETLRKYQKRVWPNLSPGFVKELYRLYGNSRRRNAAVAGKKGSLKRLAFKRIKELHESH